MRNEILEDHSKWRLVRGAIQDIYRKLNQYEFTKPDSLYLGTKLKKKLNFIEPPIYYADPGSPIERAFKKSKPILDADRIYSVLFEALNIISLDVGETVIEKFQASDQSLPANNLQNEIVDGLAPFLLAPIIAKSETAKADRSELIIRRLRERVKVRTASNLTVTFTL